MIDELLPIFAAAPPAVSPLPASTGIVYSHPIFWMHSVTLDSLFAAPPNQIAKPSPRQVGGLGFSPRDLSGPSAFGGLVVFVFSIWARQRPTTHHNAARLLAPILVTACAHTLP